MRANSLLVLCAFVISGCAESFIENAERAQTLGQVSANQLHYDVATLNAASNKASRMAYTYVQAASQVVTVQDAASAVVLISVGATAYGLATDVSGTALAERALPGIIAGFSGRRYASSTTIQAIYSGAQRLNCISAKAGIAGSVGAISRAGLEAAAVTATRSAMLDAQIMTRADVVRENTEFKDLFDEIDGSLKGVTTGANSTDPNTAVLTTYIAELLSCLSRTQRPVGSSAPVSNSPNPDVPPKENEDIVES